ncbi:MAG: hypothetical protein C7B46_18760 [Sulfobacillus benefaciens]|uniref:SGNH hydrolase-type esterase domain-containing protein n=1 Tax=Sulfobacillus benefaciens TaxID=453960 RepID=A0A2T2X3L0_9FIRM|nr:MAG: hypothetical protein C7B46_18760 [Sulfobacillus benefaciens]
MKTWSHTVSVLVMSALTTLLMSGSSVYAATTGPMTLYVSPQGSNVTGQGSQQSPYQTIDYALSVAPVGSTVVLMPGTYKESPIIAQQVTLTSEPGQAANTIIDAAGYNNAILISGPDASGTKIVGLTLENSNNQAILGVDASHLSVIHDVISGNGKNMTPSIFQDKAITLMGSTGSLISNNVITGNQGGGIALTDDGFFSPGLADPLAFHPSLPSQDNLIVHNTISDNTAGCGVVVGSFDAAGSLDNQIIDNTVTGNPQGIDIGVAPMGSRSIGNVVSGNVITGNDIPGVLVHLTAPHQVMSDTIVVDNTISGNGPDPEFGLTKPAGIVVMGTGSTVTDTDIANNTISQEYYGTWINNGTAIHGLSQNVAGSTVAVPSFTVIPEPTVSLAGPQGWIAPGTAVRYTLSSSVPMWYQFWLRNPQGVWKLMQNYSPNPTVQLGKLGTGTYMVAGYAMTPTQLAHHQWSAAIGQTAIVESGGSAAVSVSGLATVGSAETLTASSQNVSNPQYQYWIETPEGKWIQSGAYQSGPFSFTPEEPGIYHVAVYAKPLQAVATAQQAVMSTSTVTVVPAANALVALGDSISFGYNLGPNLQPSPLAFPYLIGQDENLPVDDMAVPGWTSTNLLTALPTVPFVEALKSAKVVTIDIGSNDLLSIGLQDGILFSGQTSLTPAEQEAIASAIKTFGSNLGNIVSLVQKEAPSAKMVLYNIYNPIPPQMAALNGLVNTPITAMNDEIAQVAAQDHLAVANAYEAFAGQQQMDVLTEDVHPSPAGQMVLAKIGEQVLASENS